jgi:hypothetical protein
MWFWPVNRMSLRPGLLWLTLNLALIIQNWSRNIVFSILRTPKNVFAYPRLKITVLEASCSGGKGAVSPGVRRPTLEADHSPPSIQTNKKQTPWSEFASELYRPSDRRLSAKWLPTFTDRGCHMVSVTDPYVRILGFLDRSRYLFYQVAPQLYSRDWVDPVPDPLLFFLVVPGIEPGRPDL